MAQKFKEYKQLNLARIAQEISDFWEREELFEKSISTRQGSESFIFFEGPPSANGKPGIHHVISRTIKDLFCRFQTMKGKQVMRKGGWDTHGLPVELGVERDLGITKEDIGKKISVEHYNNACRKAVMKYTDLWEDLTKQMGYWVDMDHPYITYKTKYIESLWWLLKQLFDKGLLYKGYSIQPYSPAAGTGLSSHELNMPGTYKDVTDLTITAQFKTKQLTLPQKLQKIEDEVFLLAWTTTPWTLPSNTALTVGEKINYSVIRTFNLYTYQPVFVILATELIEKQFPDTLFKKTGNESDFQSFKSEDKKKPYQIVQSLLGSDLLGIEYEQLLPWALPYQNADKAFRVIGGDFVTIEDGTGIVHTAPTFGADDAKVAKANGIPALLVLDKKKNPVPLVNLQGKFIDLLPDKYRNKFVKNEYYKKTEEPARSVDVEIAIELKERNRAFRVEKYVHNYPHCWRTDKPIIYYPLDSWFIKTTQMKERLIEHNSKINWKPKATGEGRFGNWLENINDWNLSRSRYWGTPIPIWKTRDQQEIKIIGSVSELLSEIEASLKAGVMSAHPFPDFEKNNFSDQNYDKIDLHKHVVDQIVLVSNSGEPMYREPDLIDVWFDSGAMPYAQWHYPFSDKSKRLIDEKKMFPADFICEGVDQTRGWFYTLHAIGVMLFDSVAFKNVVSNGLVLDRFGQKMSKRLNNSVDPFETIKEYGPDSTRWYLISNCQPWDNLKFNVEGIDEVRRKFFGTLYNTYSFFALYANVDGFRYKEDKIPIEKRTELDQWIISELNTLTGFVDHQMSQYEPSKSARAIQRFVTDNLSNWYVRLNRRRFWKSQYSEDKIAAFQTLYECLVTVAKLGAPIAPFFMDRLYKDLNTISNLEPFDSVNIAYFPNFSSEFINPILEEKIRLAQEITSMSLGLRKKEGIKVRQPLQSLLIPILNENEREKIESVVPLFQKEVNVKEVRIISDDKASDVLTKTVKPNFRLLGPRFGRQIKEVASKISKFGQQEINELDRNGTLSIEIRSQKVLISKADVEISTQDIQGWKVSTQNGLTVALDISISEELKREGIARELINRIQNLRKNIGLYFTDSIFLSFEKKSALIDVIESNKNYICTETLAKKIEYVDGLEDYTILEIDDVEIKINLQKYSVDI